MEHQFRQKSKKESCLLAFALFLLCDLVDVQTFVAHVNILFPGPLNRVFSTQKSVEINHTFLVQT